MASLSNTDVVQMMLDRLLPERVDDAAYKAVRELLALDGTAFVDYQPGDGTSYKLVLTRFQYRTWQHRAEATLEQMERSVWGMTQDGSYVIVGWIGHGCYPFEVLSDLGCFVDPGYFSEHMPTNSAGAIAMCTLLNRIAEIYGTHTAHIKDDGSIHLQPKS